MSRPISIFVDADACPVKAEIYRVAERFALKGVAITQPDPRYGCKTAESWAFAYF